MGRAVEGNLLTMQELEANRLLILTKYKKYLQHQLSKLADYTNKLEYPHIEDIGFECEGWFINDKLLPNPVYEQVVKLVPDIGRELLSCQWEVRNEKDNLIKLQDPLQQTNECVKGVFAPIQDAAQKCNTKLLIIGGHPFFTADLANTMITNSKRHQKLIEYIDSYDTNTINIPFVNGDETRQGMIYEGYTTSIQITIRVSPIFASLYHDAYYLIAPILLAMTAYSPIIEGKETHSDSMRVQIVGDSCYGFSEEDKAVGMPSRWGPFPPISQPDTVPSKWANQDLYNLLRSSKVPNGVSLHFAEVAGKEKGHLLVTDTDLEIDPLEGFPSPIMWPYVKIQPFGMNEGGILIELRFIEMVRKQEEISLLLHFLGTMLEVVTHDLHLQKLSPLQLIHFNENEKTCSLQNALSSNKAINWPHNGEVIKRPVKDILRELLDKMIPHFHKNGRTPEEIEEICNVFVNRVGLRIKGDSIEECNPTETAAQEMRRKGPTQMIEEYLF